MASLGSLRPAVMVALAVASAASARPAWDVGPLMTPPAALLRAAAARPAPQGVAFELLLEESRLVFDGAGRKTDTWRRVYRVLDVKALEGWSEAAVQWRPWQMEAPELQARVVTADGTEHVLNRTTLVDSPTSGSEGLFSDARILHGPLPGLADGAVVEVVITLRDREPQFHSGVAHSIGLQNAVPTRATLLHLEMPEEMPFKQAVEGISETAVVRTNGGRRLVDLELGASEAIRADEENLPRGEPVIPVLHFSTVDSWRAAATEYAGLVDRQLATSDLHARAREVIGDAKTPAAASNRILSWLRSVRYTGVEFGDAAYIPRTPEETLQRKYGDCKDLATLVVGMLRAGGFSAHVALLRVNGADISAQFPGLNRFDHAIVYVEGAEPFFLDATVPAMGAGELPWMDQGRLALVAAPSTIAPLAIPVLPAASNRVDTEILLELGDAGPGKVREVRTASGDIANSFRAGRRQGRQRAEEYYGKYFKTEFDAPVLQTLEEEDGGLGQPFRITLAGGAAKRAATHERDASIAVHLFRVFWYLPNALTETRDARHQPRKQPLQFVPYQASASYRIIPPPGWLARRLPEKLVTTLGPASIEREYVAQPDRSVLVTMRFDSGPGVWSAEQVEAFRTALATLLEQGNPSVAFDADVARALSEGRTREALEAARAQVAAHPAQALPRSQMARALLTAGFGEEARAAARRGCELEPTSARAWRTLGWVLEHDGLGRRFHRGFDMAGATAAYRKSNELEPTYEGVGDLAILLEYDADGDHYAPGARLTDAATEYRYLRDKLNRKELDGNLLLVLFRSAQVDAVLQLAPEVKPGTVRNAVWTAAVALKQGAAAAVAQAERLSQTDDERGTLLRGAAFHLTAVRSYPLAAELLAAGTRGNPDGQSASLLVLLSKAHRVDGDPYPADDPRAAVVSLIRLMLNREVSPAELKSLFAPEVLKDGSVLTEGPSQVAPVQKAMLASFRKLGLGRDVVLDLTLSTMELRVEGTAATGWNVRMSAAGHGPAEDAYVVPGPGHTQLLGFSLALGPLGERASALADSGNLKEARQWLDWARSSVSGLPNAGGESLAAFLTLWNIGGDSTVEAIRNAAAVLSLKTAQADPSAQRVESLRTTAGELLRSQLDVALATYYDGRKAWAALQTVGSRMLESDHGSRPGFGALSTALLRQQKLDEAERLGTARLAALPGDEVAYLFLTQVEEYRGNLDKARATAQQGLTAGRAGVVLYNTAAWLAVVAGNVDEVAIDAATRALGPRKDNAFALNTLAAAKAIQGKGPEAFQLVLKTLEVSGDREPQSADWFVIGLVAESYGLPDAARAAYQRSAKGDEAGAPLVTTPTLSRRRLERLGRTAAAHESTRQPGGATPAARPASAASREVATSLTSTGKTPPPPRMLTMGEADARTTPPHGGCSPSPTEQKAE